MKIFVYGESGRFRGEEEGSRGEGILVGLFEFKLKGVKV